MSSPLAAAPVVVVVAYALLAAPAAEAAITGREVQAAVRAAVRAIRQAQQADGTWPERNHPGGATCLATLALLQAGEPVRAPHMRRALARVAALPNQRTYVVSLKIMVLAAADARGYLDEIRTATRWLIDAQNATGLWNYTPGGTRFDHSNSQFALLGLHEASQVGVEIPRIVWRRALRQVLETQNPDGGWCYQDGEPSYGSMTAAGVADLFILGVRLHQAEQARFERDDVPCCGRWRMNRPLERGLQWIGRHFRPDLNPPTTRMYIHYWLYAVERVGILSGRRFLGEHDWYREGVEYLVPRQDAAGRWNSDLVDTCFALLFLAKGHKSLLVQKLQWSDDEEWSPNPDDLANLTSFIGDRLGQPVTWQTGALDAPLEDWLAAPLLFIQGYRFPELSEAQRDKLRRFVEQGGTLLAEATCGRPGFQRRFEEFARAAFPEVPLRPLGPDHALYHVLFDVAPLSEDGSLEPYALQGIEFGCRTAVIYSPRDLSCSWALADIPFFSERNFQLGANIAAYAVGRRPLIDRLDAVVLPAEEEPADLTAPPVVGALQLAQVVYEGDWQPFPLALVRLAEFVRDELNLDVVTRYRPVRLTAEDLYKSPVLFLAGHFDFELSLAERQALENHLRRGGFLIADACCGTEPFGQAVRELAQELFAEAELRKLPLDHAIFTGNPGFDVTTVQFSPDVLRAEPSRTTPELWGLEVDGRLAVVFSPYSLSCGLSGPAFDGCWGYAQEDARRLAANLVLYALTH